MATLHHHVARPVGALVVMLVSAACVSVPPVPPVLPGPPISSTVFGTTLVVGEIAASPDGGTVHLRTVDEVVTVESPSGVPVGRLPVDGCRAGMAAGADGATFYGVDGSGAITTYDLRSGRSTRTPGLDRLIRKAVRAPDGSRFFLRGIQPDVIVAIDAATGVPIGPSLPAVGRSDRLRAAPDSRTVWSFDSIAETWTITDPTTGTARTLAVPDTLGGLGFSPDGARAYLRGPQDTVTVLDVASLRPVGEIALPASTFVRDLLVSPSGAYLFVVTGGVGKAPDMLVIELASGRVQQQFTIDDDLIATTMSADGRRLFSIRDKDPAINIIYVDEYP